MFDSADDARRALEGEFAPQLVDQIVAALVPAIVLAPADGDRLGGTRLGGTPDQPAGLEWPRPTPPDDPEAIARRGSAEVGVEMRAHFAGLLPYAFIAQIDLEETASLGSVAATLPADGRLLFFYDLAVGPWEGSERVARVVWDRAPRESLTAIDPPADLAAAADRWHANLVANLAKHAMKPPERDDNVYRLGAMPSVQNATLLLPSTHCLEIEAIPAIASAAQASQDAAARDLYFDYGEVIERVDSCYHQLLGSPKPDQDDPRYEAVTFTQFGQQHLSSERWAEHREKIVAQAGEWRLLLQVALSEWGVMDGIVYFLIRADDLAARRFERVVAIYQQT